MTTNAPARAIPARASVHLELLRGAAALAVFFGHARGLFLEDYAIGGGGPIKAAVYFATSLGHPSVIVFFVLSGLLIGTSVLNAYDQNRFTWKDYLTRRLTRLWVVLVPALLLGALWDRLGACVFGTVGTFYGNDPHGAAFGTLDFATQSTLSTFAANLFFLQTLKAPTFGTNGPLWSLSLELWFYLLFPAMIGVIARRADATTRAANALFFVAMVLFLGVQIFEPYSLWLFGALLAALLDPRVVRLARLRRVAVPIMLAGGVLVGVALVAGRSGRVPTTPFLDSDHALAVAVTVLIFGVLQTRSAPGAASRGWIAYETTSKFISKFSYSLYLLHFPMLVFLQSWFIHDRRWSFTGGSVFGVLCLTTVTLSYCYAVAWATEFKTDTVRRWVTRKLAPTGAGRPIPERAE